MLTSFKVCLTQGKFALVDSQDYVQFCDGIKWSYSGHRNTKRKGYAIRRTYPNGRYAKGLTHLLHREIAAQFLDIQGLEVDHINGDTLDCRRNNLRTCTSMNNKKNRSLGINNTSGFKGVVWHKINKCWTAGIRVDNKRYFLGSFSDKIQAAHAYDEAARKFHGKFARLNFP